MCGPERMFLRHERRLALASPSLSISLTAPLHDGECLTVPEDKGGSRDTLDDQIGERETEEVRQEATAATKDP